MYVAVSLPEWRRSTFHPEWRVGDAAQRVSLWLCYPVFADGRSFLVAADTTNLVTDTSAYLISQVALWLTIQAVRPPTVS